MPPKLRAAFYEAIIEYGTTGAEPTLPKSISGYWPLVQPMLDAAKKHYDAGTNGGRPSETSSFGLSNSETNGSRKEKEKEKEKEKQQPTAPPAAVAPHKGALGGSTVLGSKTTECDSETEAARQRFLNSIKRPAWPADDLPGVWQHPHRQRRRTSGRRCTPVRRLHRLDRLAARSTPESRSFRPASGRHVLHRRSDRHRQESSLQQNLLPPDGERLRRVDVSAVEELRSPQLKGLAAYRDGERLQRLMARWILGRREQNRKAYSGRAGQGIRSS